MVKDNNKMKSAIRIDAKLKDLDLVESMIDASAPLKGIFKLFEKNDTIPGVIVFKNGKYFQMVSKIRFFEVMSQEFMLELYSKRSVESFFQDYREDNSLFQLENETVLTAANQALRRNELFRQDPIIVEHGNGKLKLLDFYELLLAQTQVHMLTLNSLKEANEFKKEILGVAAHDLRNPLNAIMGFSRLIEEMATDNDELHTYAKYINGEAHNMNELFSELLKSAANDATELEINKSIFDLVELATSILISFTHSFQIKKQGIDFKSRYEKLLISADKQKIKEIIENLISNAIKYSPHKKNISVRINSEELNAIIEVIDEGQGFSREDLTKIFGKYQKLSAKPTNNETSTGLGLYIIKKIIDNHGGKISVTSELGKGSAFRVIIPGIINDNN
jgi:signal transduction histidine kinase